MRGLVCNSMHGLTCSYTYIPAVALTVSQPYLMLSTVENSNCIFNLRYGIEPYSSTLCHSQIRIYYVECTGFGNTVCVEYMYVENMEDSGLDRIAGAEYRKYKMCGYNTCFGNTWHDRGVHGVGVDCLEEQTKMGRLQGEE